MQETTAGPAHGGTGSVTIADIVSLAAERYGERPAARFKRDDEWREVSYTELAETVSEIARGLVDLGLQQGERVALLCTTRVEWTYADFAITSAGGVVVPIYPDQLARGVRVGRRQLASRASSSARTPRRWRRSSPCATSCRSSSRSSRSSPVEGAISVDELRERGRGA